MIVPLVDAVAETGGGKAGPLGSLLRRGLPVPDGFVIPFSAYRAVIEGLDLAPAAVAVARRAIESRPLPAGLIEALTRALGLLDAPAVAVRSSASNEDTAHASAAGQHESVLGVRRVDEVVGAIRACWSSLHSPRAVDYREASDEPAMAVLIQRLVDAEMSGVLFTPAGPGLATQIEASWGLGPSVVGGTVTPDAYRVDEDGSIVRTIADKRTRLDRHGSRLVARSVPTPSRNQPTLDDATAVQLAHLGRTVAAALGGAQDIEWAIAAGRIWILQARPVTAAPPAASQPSPEANASPATLTGTPGSHGSVTGTARIVRGPGDFARVRPGDILVCPTTDPAWTPLLRIAAGVVTDIGGVLSHAAIVAREQRIPAVLGIADATTTISDGTVITVDGSSGTVTASA